MHISCMKAGLQVLLFVSLFIITYITSKKRHSYSYLKVKKKVLPWVTQHLVRLMNLTRRKEKWKISSSQITKGNIKSLTIEDKMVYLNLSYSKILGGGGRRGLRHSFIKSVKVHFIRFS